VYKVLYILKRRQGISHEEFIDHYENIHAKLVKIACPRAKRYFRKYLEPIPDNGSRYDQTVPPANSQAFDVITEIWFESKDQFDSVPGMNDPELVRVINEDEDKLFEMGGGFLRLTYDEKETPLGM
jgi:hypothetical protein